MYLFLHSFFILNVSKLKQNYPVITFYQLVNAHFYFEYYVLVHLMAYLFFIYFKLIYSLLNCIYLFMHDFLPCIDE